MRSHVRRRSLTPTSQILNRFSRDVYVIDEVLARVFGGFFRTLAGVFGAFPGCALSRAKLTCCDPGMVAVISFSAPSFLLVFTPLLFVYKRIQTCVLALLPPCPRLTVVAGRYYLATSRELKRLDAVTKSPIFASFQVRACDHMTQRGPR